MSPAIFPFCAVIGQAKLKLALILTAVDPQIGGVLISGPRGSAKSTLARGLAEIGSYTEERFVNLPLGATEEKLIGCLDLNKVLKNGDVEFLPGLLHRAHKGILYIDEVNLLADHLVDLLLDVAASGVNVVERDAISHQHEAKFVLIGTMNPDEGELRPQLIDRFGLCVVLANTFSIEERAEVARRRLAYDDDAMAFRNQFAQEQRQLNEKVLNAQSRLLAVEVHQQQLAYVAQLCQQADVEGLRADITIIRAARAHAAWHSHEEVSNHDIDQVADLVLVHRRQVVDNMSAYKNHANSQQSLGNDTQYNEPQSQQAAANKNRNNVGFQSDSKQQDLTQQSSVQQNSTQHTQSQGDWGEMSPVAVSIGGTRPYASLANKKKV